MESATRSVLDALEVKLNDMPGASCCPNQMTVQSGSVGVWYLLAARNLCIAEEMGMDILTLCNGCFDTLKTANSWLKVNSRFRERINDILANFGEEFKGTIDVKNILQVLHDDVGTGRIEGSLVHPLNGLRIAPFVGCHVRRPMDKMGFEDPQEPQYLVRLVKGLGGEIVGYAEKNSCCGGGLSVARKEDAYGSSRRILRSAREAGAEAMVVNCPYCYSQLHRGQPTINERFHDGLEIPIMYITQMMGVAMGIPLEELGFEEALGESSSPERILAEGIATHDEDEDSILDKGTMAQVEVCSRCLACTDDCPTAMTVNEYRPEEIITLVRKGRAMDAARREDIWFCMNCHECVEKCPQGYGMVRLMIELKNRASEMGIRPDVVERRLESLRASGFAFNSKGEAPGSHVDELQDLIEKASKERFQL
ncbi:MAG: 4Fe-4S dicluster domain-containing protein [Methanomassiliicoccales archaeon]|nr:4Fe-4S dicluster domain-containing protein [Methanomassiliicoccales archaeon]NYT16163.1 4Fe-4S dicluster domain-containing protein [Methanomassiliicoccales archaeon]